MVNIGNIQLCLRKVWFVFEVYSLSTYLPDGSFYVVLVFLCQTFILMLKFCYSRAMELGRECLKLWGYERVDEIIWVKTNQLQRIIRTGRTGHWLNHGKEHCLVG